MLWVGRCHEAHATEIYTGTTAVNKRHVSDGSNQTNSLCPRKTGAVYLRKQGAKRRGTRKGGGGNIRHRGLAVNIIFLPVVSQDLLASGDVPRRHDPDHVPAISQNE